MVVIAVFYLSAVAEVKLRPLHGAYLSRGYELAVHRKIAVGVYQQLVAQNIALAAKVKIAVVCEVYHRVPVRACAVVDENIVVLRKLVGYAYRDISREAVPSVGVSNLKDDAAALRAHCIKTALAEARSAVERIFPLVGGQLICIAAQRKLRPRDAVCVSAHCSSEVSVIIKILLRSVVAQNDVAHDAVPVGHNDAAYRGSQIRHLEPRALRIFYRIQIVFTEAVSCYRHFIHLPDSIPQIEALCKGLFSTCWKIALKLAQS